LHAEEIEFPFTYVITYMYLINSVIFTYKPK
jgi:hypothetical protein